MAVVLVYFLKYVTFGLHMGFAIDDPMNIYYYWTAGPGETVKNLALFFTTFQRPMGGIYYTVLYEWFGLDPFPYHAVALALLGLNVWLAYRFGSLIAESRLAGGLCAFFASFHVGTIILYYQPSFIFDILCFTFYFLTLNYYLSVRARSLPMNAWRTAAFLLLYIGALDSKEMAVTLPVIALVYELLWRPPERWRAAVVARWARTTALAPLLAGGLTAVYILGKTFGSDSLVGLEPYHPVFTVERFFESTSRFMNTLFYQRDQGGFFNARTVILVAVTLLAMAWRLKKKYLLFLWVFVFVTPLPITFLPRRGGGNLYIPLTGWSALAGGVLTLAGGVIARLKWMRWAPAAVVQAALALFAVGYQWKLTDRLATHMRRWVERDGALTADVLGQIRTIQPRVKPGAAIYVIGDVFQGYDTKFLFELQYHDRSVRVFQDRDFNLSPAEIERMDYVFRYENGRLKKLKGA